jgi:UPF0271 protein
VLDESARNLGLKYAPELAIDRARQPNGEPVSRREPNAVTTDPLEVADRAERIVKERKMKAVNGQDITIGPFYSFCVHGDNPNALEVLRMVRARLDKIGLKIRPLKEFFD